MFARMHSGNFEAHREGGGCLRGCSQVFIHMEAVFWYLERLTEKGEDVCEDALGYFFIWVLYFGI
jgi:hypothetical protein